MTLLVQHTAKGKQRGGPPFNSVLSDGQVYQLAVNTTGMHKLTYSFLKNDLGINDLDNIDPRTIRLYGNGGGIVPFDVNTERPEDLVENAIRIVGEADGRFDSGDYILFYAEAADKWRFRESDSTFYLEKNIFDTRNYYFIKTGATGQGIRVAERPTLNSTEVTSTTYDGRFRLEEDKVNALHEIESTGTGTGQRWYGDFFRFAREKSYDNLFQLTGLRTDEPARIWSEMALRGNLASRFFIDIDGQTLQSTTASGIPIGSPSEINGDLARTAVINQQVMLSNEIFSPVLRYPNPGGAESQGWLDFIQVQARMALQMVGQEMAFRDVRTRTRGSVKFTLSNVNREVEIWDITHPLLPVSQQLSVDGTTRSFGVATAGLLREFHVFETNMNFATAEAVGRVAAQNLHALGSRQMLIIYHPDFEEQALTLAEHRRSFGGLTVEAVPVGQVYNEFSSGRVDPTAIRDFSRLIFERDGGLQYLLVIGDGSFDCRDIYEFGNNFIPVYEKDSNSEIRGYPADDYFVIFENAPGADPLANDISISVGRLPVKSVEEAQTVVAKIIDYDTNPDYLLDWRTRMTFLGDDEDTATHSDDANDAANLVLATQPMFAVNKLFFDLFPQESTAAGDRFPAVQDELDRAIFKGAVITTYLGHGGPRGWAQERVLDIPRIQSWENRDKMSLFLTATCTFGDFDNSAFVSAGEELLLSGRGGAIALLTTTRPVVAFRNAALTNRSLTELMTQNTNTGQWAAFGDVIRIAKNSLSTTGSFDNERKFTLLGDPAQRVAFPRYKIATTSINGQPIDPSMPDTLSALETATIAGRIEDLNGQLLSNFNGTVYATIYDKELPAQALRNDPESSPERTYMVRKNILFRGKATVTNGVFSFSFVVPKDVNYAFGPGKIIYYAADPSSVVDAAGSEERFIIGGSNPDGLEDDTPPLVEVFMNSEDFVAGSQVTTDPVLLVKLSDDLGINVTGNSIGHDLEGFLNENTQNSYLLNDFYEAANNDYSKGEVRFPLKDLAAGTYTMRVRAWDVANNMGEGQTEFVVADDGKLALDRVLNYPNPFTTQTCFQFDTNVAGEDMDVLIQIYTISGRLVKTLEAFLPAVDGALRLDDCITWDGRDDFGDELARGVYLYKVRVRTSSGQELSGESEFEKLVILR
ncbi:MAG: type IX secretion system sortase PorU [Saprospiraceae bacterium]